MKIGPNINIRFKCLTQTTLQGFDELSRHKTSWKQQTLLDTTLLFSLSCLSLFPHFLRFILSALQEGENMPGIHVLLT